jgi:ketosteroid isomerase-like protein
VVDRGLAQQVETMLKAFGADGVEGLLAYCEDDVDWVPHGAGERVLHGSNELRAFFAEQAALGERRELTVYAIEPFGDAVLLTGAIRRLRQGRLTESQLAWVWTFRDGRLRSAVSYPTRAAALRAVTVAA